MALALPLVGALGGGLFAYGLGYTSLTALTIGASAGWLVGSWGMYSMMDTKNNPIDTGAEEAPRFNTAVRGAIIPILFGTNRVPAQITWQSNFEAIRSETDGGGGGKFGGSGGGKAPSGPGSVSYTYKIDAVYHLGLVPTTYSLLGGWLGPQRVSDDSIASIGIAGSSGTSYESLALTTEDTTDAGFSYDEGVYFDGNIDEENDWDWLTSQVGQPVCWPGTTWVGFKGLLLGSSPNMLQIQFEVGPTPGNVEVNTDAQFREAATGADGFTGVDAFGNVYFSDAHTAGAVRCYAADGTLLFEFATSSDITTWFASSATGWLTGVSAAGSSYIVPIEDGTKIAIAFQVTSSGPFFGTKQVLAVVDAPDPSSWTPGDKPPIGSRWCWVNQGAAFLYIRGIHEFKYNITGNTQMIVVIAWEQVSATTYFMCYPSVDSIYNHNTLYIGAHPFAGALSPYQIARLIYTSSDVSALGDNVAQASNIDQDMNWAVVTNVNAVGDVVNFFITWVGPDYSPTWNSYASRYFGTYPNGVMIQLNLPRQEMESYPFGGGVSSIVALTPGDEQVINNLFVDSSGNVVVPFDDQGNDLLGNPASGGNDPAYVGRPFVKQLLAYPIYSIVGFTMLDQGNYTSTFGTPVAGVTVQVFLYNSLTNEYTRLGHRSAFAIQQGDLGQTWDTEGGTVLTINTVQSYYYNGELYIAGSAGSNQFVVKLGTLDFQGQDVTPPYIIRQILTHAVFGVEPGADAIDEDSYATAVAFCEANNIKVSTQYRREGPVLNFIELLLALYGGFLRVLPATNQIKFGVMDLSNNPIRTLDNHHLVRVNDDEPPVEVTKGAREDTANIIRVNYIDRTLGYQNNQVEDRDEVDEDLTGPRTREFPPDFVMSRDLAQWIATRSLWNGLYTRDAYKAHITWKDADLEPGDVVTLVDSYDNINEVAQIVTKKEVERGLWELRLAQQLTYVAGYKPSQISSGTWDALAVGGTSTSSLGYLTGSGTISTSGITINPSSQYVAEVTGPLPAPLWSKAYELPQEFQTSPQVYVGWAADAFAAGAKLYVSVDNISFAQALDVTPYPITGKVLTSLPAQGQVFEEDVEIILHPNSSWSVSSPSYIHNATLNDVSEAAMHLGTGVLWVGSEMLAYQNITLVAQNRYRLKRVYRGWGGTNIQAHTSGDTFHKHGSGIFAREYTTDQIGTTFYYKVVPYNLAGQPYSVSSVVAQQYQVKGAYYFPQNPTTLQSSGNRGINRTQVGSEVDIGIEWQDSARRSGYGAGGFGTAPGGFGGFTTDTLSHQWEVVVVGSGGSVVRSTAVGTPAYTYTNSQNFSDNGAWRKNVAFQVTAVSPYGRSPRTSVISMELFL